MLIRVVVVCVLALTLWLGARYWYSGDPHAGGAIVFLEAAPAIALVALLSSRSRARVRAAALLAYAGVGVLLLVTLAAALWGDSGVSSPYSLARVTNMPMPLIMLTVAGTVAMLVAAVMIGKPLRLRLAIGAIAFVALLVSVRAFVFR